MGIVRDIVRPIVRDIVNPIDSPYFSWSRYWSALIRNIDSVFYGGYITVVDAGGITLDGKAEGRWFLNNAHESRIRQAGILIKVKIYRCPSGSWDEVTHYFLQVWRKNGANYDLVGEEDILAGMGIPSEIKTIDLVTAINVEEGDYIGTAVISGVGDDADNTTYAMADHIDGLNYKNTPEPTDTDFDWDSQAQIDYVMPIKVYGQAPFIVGIGDSIMAGHTTHYSFIESQYITDITNQLLYQMQTINSLFIYQNMGDGGQNTSQIESRFDTDLIALKPKVALINGGVNDIAGAGVKATFLTKWTSMIDKCIAADIIPIVCKIMPWTNGTNDQMQDRDDWNTDLTTLVNSYPSKVWLVDFDGLGVFRAGGDVGNLWDIQAAYDVGGAHFNLAGYTKAAEIIMNTIHAS